jgi:hypothetical protein
MASALADLRKAATGLGQTVTELVMIVIEDRPSLKVNAFADDLAETVSELQAGAVLAEQRIVAIRDPRRLPDQLWSIDEAVAGCAGTYWRDLRSFTPVRELRRTAANRGNEWRAWQHSVELSLLRCETPLLHATDAVRAAWQEIGELLANYLPTSPAPETASSTTPDDETSTRRSP